MYARKFEICISSSFQTHLLWFAFKLLTHSALVCVIILIRVSVDLELSPGTLTMRQKYTHLYLWGTESYQSTYRHGFRRW